MRYLGIGIKLLSQNVFKPYCVDETSLFNLLWIQPLRWLLDIEVSWSFCHGRTAWWPLCWQEDPVPGSLVLWLICHHLQFNQLKVTLATKYLLLFSIVISLYIKRNPNLVLPFFACWKYLNQIFQQNVSKWPKKRELSLGKSQQIVRGQGPPSKSTTTEHQRPSKTSSSIGSPRE